MISITVLYFAALAEHIGCGRETVTVPADLDDRGLCALIAARHPQAAALLGRTRVAADHAFVRGPLNLRPGMDIALIPPVSGG